MNLNPNCRVELFDLILRRFMSFFGFGNVLKLIDEFEDDRGDEADEEDDVDGVITCC